MKPIDSVAPLVPSTSDNPRRAGSFVGWFDEIREWIAGLSPSGASKYDTGVINSGLTFTPENATDITYDLLRRGKRVTARIHFTYTGPTMTANAAGNFTDTPLLIIPVGWRTMLETSDVALRSAVYRVGGSLSTSGMIYLADGPPGVTVSNGDGLRLHGSWEVA